MQVLVQARTFTWRLLVSHRFRRGKRHPHVALQDLLFPRSNTGLADATACAAMAFGSQIKRTVGAGSVDPQ